MNKTDESILTEQFVSEQFSAVREMLVRNAASLRQNTAEMEQKLRFLQKHQEYLQLQIREKSFFVRLGRFGGLLLSVGKCGLLHPRRGLHLLREIQTIRRSGMFDEIFYLQNNRDLRGRFLFSPIVHFCRNGWLEGRNPSPDFDVLFYLRNNDDVRDSGQNPLLHFITRGRYESRQPLMRKKKSELPVCLPIPEEKHPSGVNYTHSAAVAAEPKIAVVVPVYNGFSVLLDCVTSLLEYILKEVRLLLIDDCSPDPRIKKLFGQLKERFAPRLETCRNETNLGFVRTVNRGFELAAGCDVIILNSDTVVSHRWSTLLKLAAYRSDAIGTVSAVSNNSNAFSVPIKGENPLPPHQTLPQISRMYFQHARNWGPEIHNGHGFCMYIKRALLDDVGMFDAETFGLGYGEENDFCMRAFYRGWTHSIADAVLVYHVNAQSFGPQKEERVQKAREILHSRYPELPQLNRSLLESAFQPIREQAAKLEQWMYARRTAKPRVLYVICVRTGGTPQTNRDLMSAIREHYEPFLLFCQDRTLQLFDCRRSEKLLEEYRLENPVNFFSLRSGEYDRIAESILLEYKIELIHVRHIGFNSIGLFPLAKRLAIPVVFSFHDFYTICPSVKLVDRDGTFWPHGITNNRANIGLGKLPAAFLPELNEAFSKRWKNTFNTAVFPYCDRFVTTESFARDLLLENFSEISRRPEDFHVIPHGRNFTKFLQPEDRFPESGERLRILVPGNISREKGAAIILRLKELDVENRLEFHILGEAVNELRSKRFAKSIIIHGGYERDQFAARVARINPVISVIFSIWPETWCHTLTESWSAGLPVAAFDLGAVGRRLQRECRGGWLLDRDPQILYRQLLDIKADKPGYLQRLEAIAEWQSGFGRNNTIERMASMYMDIYSGLLQPDHAGKPVPGKTFGELLETAPRLGLIPRPSRNGFFASSCVRLLDWRKAYEETGARVDVLNALALDRTAFDRYDALVICRDAIPEELVSSFLLKCALLKLPFYIELDDNPLLTQEHVLYLPVLKRLMRHAAGVVVSVPELAEAIAPYASNISVKPNALNRQAWIDGIKAPLDIETLEIIQNKRREVNVIYFGSRTHDDDLALINPVVARLKKEFPVQFFMIGGTRQKTGCEEWITLPVPNSEYYAFISWLRSVSEWMNIAVAPLSSQKPMNAFKSPLKFLENSICGLPTVCSKVVYGKLVENGVTAVVVDGDDPEAWYTALADLIRDRGKREQIARNARELVLEKHMISQEQCGKIK